MIRFKHKGDLSKTTRYFERVKHGVKPEVLTRYADEGLAALASATPMETGLTANSWGYEITNKNGIAKISFFNTNVQNGVPIAVIIQYGHGTRNGGWVEGRDYINPAIQPVFDRIAKDGWREVTKS